jgi:hypothetical protein
VVVGERFLVPHLQMKVSLVIAGEQTQMSVRNRMTIHSIENADGNGLVVDDREILIRATHLTCVNQQWKGQTKSESENDKLRPTGPVGLFGHSRSLPIVLNRGHA